MIRVYCDSCGVELRDHEDRVSDRIKRAKGIYEGKHPTLTVEVLVAIEGGWNGGNACAKCVLDAVANGADV